VPVSPSGWMTAASSGAPSIASDMFQACGWPARRKNPFSFGSHFFCSGSTPTNGVMAAA
jgi:hypothetical protein